MFGSKNGVSEYQSDAVSCDSQERLGRSRNLLSFSGGASVILIEQAAQTRSLVHLASFTIVARIWADKLIVETLMIAFGVVVLKKLMHGFP